MNLLQKCIRLFVIISFLSTTIIAKEFMPESEWVCGAAEWDRILGYQQVNDTCYDVGIQVNQCCTVHDECYVNNGNQTECDVPFCECLIDIASKSVSKAQCRNTLEFFCLMVNAFGGFAHAHASLNKNISTTELSTITTTTRSPSALPTDECFDENKERICAEEFEHCLANANEPFIMCEERLCECTRDALKNSSNHECRNNIDKKCRETGKYKQSKRSTTFDYLFQEVQYFGYSMTILTATMATIIGIGFVLIMMSLVFRYMTRRNMPISPSRTPLFTAASSDLNFGFNSNNVILEEERKLAAHYA